MSKHKPSQVNIWDGFLFLRKAKCRFTDVYLYTQIWEGLIMALQVLSREKSYKASMKRKQQEMLAT